MQTPQPETCIYAFRCGINLVKTQNIYNLRNRCFLALAKLVRHFTFPSPLPLHNTVSVRLETQTRPIVSENHTKATWIFTAAEANSPYLAVRSRFFLFFFFFRNCVKFAIKLVWVWRRREHPPCLRGHLVPMHIRTLRDKTATPHDPTLQK